MLELKIIFIIFLQCLSTNPHVLDENPNVFSGNLSEETGTDIKTTSDNKLTHVRTKDLSGHVELTSLEVFTSNILFNDKREGRVVNAGSDEIPILEKDKQAGIQTITENILLSDFGTKGLTDGMEPFSLMDVFNRTSGTLLDQNRTEKLIIDTPSHSALIDEEFDELFQKQNDEKAVEGFSAIFSGDGAILTDDFVVGIEKTNTSSKPKPYKINNNSFLDDSVQDKSLENTNYHNPEEAEISTFIKVDHDFIKNISEKIIDASEEDNESLEDVSSIFTNYDNVTKNFTFGNLSQDNKTSNLENIFIRIMTEQATEANLPDTLSANVQEVRQDISTTQVPIGDEITVVAGFEQFDNKLEFNSANINDNFINNSDELAIETTTSSNFYYTTIDQVDNNTKVEMLTSIPAANTAAKPPIFFTTFCKNMTIKICYKASHIFIPPNAYVKQQNVSAINITWHATVPNLNHSLYLNYKHYIQLNIVRKNRIFVHRAPFILEAEDELDKADINLLRFGDGIQIYFTDLNYMEQRGGTKYDIQCDAPPPQQSLNLNILTAKIIGSFIGISFFMIFITLLVVVKIKRKNQNFKLEHTASES